MDPLLRPGKHHLSARLCAVCEGTQLLAPRQQLVRRVHLRLGRRRKHGAREGQHPQGGRPAPGQPLPRPVRLVHELRAGGVPIAGFASFYITGFGRTTGSGFSGGFSDPCTSGNDGNLYNGNGSEPPPDLDYSANTFYIWGHFVKAVVPAASTSGTTGVCASR